MKYIIHFFRIYKKENKPFQKATVVADAATAFPVPYLFSPSSSTSLFLLQQQMPGGPDRQVFVCLFAWQRRDVIYETQC